MEVRVRREPGRPPQGVAEFRSSDPEVKYTEVRISVLVDQQDVLVRAGVKCDYHPLILSADLADHDEWLGQGGDAEAELALVSLITTYIAEAMRWANTNLTIYT